MATRPPARPPALQRQTAPQGRCRAPTTLRRTQQQQHSGQGRLPGPLPRGRAGCLPSPCEFPCPGCSRVALAPCCNLPVVNVRCSGRRSGNGMGSAVLSSALAAGHHGSCVSRCSVSDLALALCSLDLATGPAQPAAVTGLQCPAAAAATATACRRRRPLFPGHIRTALRKSRDPKSMYIQFAKSRDLNDTRETRPRQKGR